MAEQVKKYQTAAPIRPKQVQLIHILAEQIMTRSEYEDWLSGFRGATSSKDLTAAEADQGIDDLVKKGAVIVSKPRPTRRPRSKGKNVINLATQGEHDKVAALAGLIPWQVEDGLSRFLVKRCQVRSGKVRTAAEAYRAIEGLKKYYTHLMEGIHGEGWWMVHFDDPAIERFIFEHAPVEYRNPMTSKVYKRTA